MCAALAAATSLRATEDPTHLRARSVAPLDCLPVAMRVYHELPGAPTCPWKRLLSARYADNHIHHVYCVFRFGDAIYAYDSTWGSRRVHPSDLSASAVARAVDFMAQYGVYID